MPTDSLPNIPTPASQRWREFRIQVMPVMMFLCLMVSLVFMWRSFVQPAGILGEVQPQRANVLSLQDGVIAKLDVDLFQDVVKDQIIGQILTKDDDLQRATIRQAETDLQVMQTRLTFDVTRSRDILAQLRIRMAEERFNLTNAQIMLAYAEREYEKAKKLFDEKLISASSVDYNLQSFDVAVRDKDRFGKEVEIRRQLVSDLETLLGEFETSGTVATGPMTETITKAIEAEKELIKLTDAPQILRAPMAGKVSMILKQPGEKVVRGEPIVTVSAPTSDRVIGYLRQPINKVPTTNDMVRVRTRSQKRLVANCPIVHVGPSLEPINPALLSPDVQRVEVGLPILIALPPQMRLVPGEFVDLAIQYAKN